VNSELNAGLFHELFKELKILDVASARSSSDSFHFPLCESFCGKILSKVNYKFFAFFPYNSWKR